MGGKAFAQDGIHVPRMDRKTFEKMRDHHIAILAEYYHHVRCPHPTPEKTDHGDVDLLAASPKQADGVTTQQLQEALQATKVIDVRHDHSERIFAIPYSILDLDQPLAGFPEAPRHQEPHVQLDVATIDQRLLGWEMLMKSYADLWQIVGKFLRRCGLTATDGGLYLRIEEIQEAGFKKDSLLFLSDDPQAICDFLGLDLQRWNDGFPTMEDMYRWCCTGRFFRQASFEAERGTDRTRGVETASDRRRMKGRPSFRRFVTDWLPANADAIFAGRPAWSREEIKAEALQYFNKWPQFNDFLGPWNARRNEGMLWQRLGAAIPRKGDNFRYAKKALRRWVVFEEGMPVLRGEPIEAEEQTPLWHVECTLPEPDLMAWVEANWEEARAKERALDALKQEEKRVLDAGNVEQSERRRDAKKAKVTAGQTGRDDIENDKPHSIGRYEEDKKDGGKMHQAEPRGKGVATSTPEG